MRKPLAVDLFCGLGGWTEGFLAEGYDVVGFDIEVRPYPSKLVIQDVLTIHGSQFRDAACITASPPCQKYSYLAMPWSRSVDIVRPCGDGWEILNSAAAKEMRAEWEHEGPDNRLFDACFRIQREAIEAQNCDCGHSDESHDHDYLNGIDDDCRECSCTKIVKRYIPLIVENVRGAIPWVGRSAWNYGSFHLWGDVPALMPINFTRRMKSRIDCGPRMFSERIASTPEEAHALHYRLPIEGQKQNPDGTDRPSGSWFRVADSSQGARGPAGQKVPVYSDPRRNGGRGVHLTSPQENAEGTKIGGDWFSDPKSTCRKHGSRSSARKAASAKIAKIPFPLAQHIALVYYPRKLKKSA